MNDIVEGSALRLAEAANRGNMPEAAVALGQVASGCVACHQGDKGEGGLSGPRLTDAGVRLQADFIAAYTKDPQRFDPHIWMPTSNLKDQDIQRLTAFLVQLSQGDK